MSIYRPVRDDLARLLSQPRLDEYKTAVGGQLTPALQLYAWNLEMSYGSHWPAIRVTNAWSSVTGMPHAALMVSSADAQSSGGTCTRGRAAKPAASQGS